jgi:hypothetical protein
MIVPSPPDGRRRDGRLESSFPDSEYTINTTRFSCEPLPEEYQKERRSIIIQKVIRAIFIAINQMRVRETDVC